MSHQRLLGIDAETTGVDPYRDRIVELSLQPTWTQPLVMRLNPGIPIPAEATAIHGISDADVADCPRFADIAAQVQEMVYGAVLVGFNSWRFDTVLIHVELIRAGQPGLPKGADGLLCPPEIDLYQLWCRSETRRLEDAVRRFTTRTPGEGAHTAEGDTAVLPEVLQGMVEQFKINADIEELIATTKPEGALDRDGKFKLREDGTVVFNFTDKKGAPALSDTRLLNWVLKKKFITPETKAFVRWLMKPPERQPRPAPPQLQTVLL